MTDNAIVAVHRPPFEGALWDLMESLQQKGKWLTTVVRTGAPTGILLWVRHPKKP